MFDVWHARTFQTLISEALITETIGLKKTFLVGISRDVVDMWPSMDTTQ